MSSITTGQILDDLIAVPVFIPAMICTGYLAAWLSNLFHFRDRSLVERLFWSLPLSVAVSTIASVLLAKAFSIDAVVIFFELSTLLFIAVLIIDRSHFTSKSKIGCNPLGGRALFLAVVWVFIAVFSLIDIQSKDQLFLSITIFDHSARVNWTESILRTGVPPANPLYFYGHPANMRYYYFWNVVCAAVSRMARLPVRSVYTASCVWGGFILSALLGLYLKHVLKVGNRLRKQFVFAISCLMISGFNSVVLLSRVFLDHGPLPGSPSVWNVEQINSWYDSLLFVPHHISSVVCCMFAFLLSWLDESNRARDRAATIIFVSVAFASAFGLSIYVAFAFFLIMLAWALWKSIFHRAFRPVLLLASGGIGAVVLLLPYLAELRGGSSGTHGGSMFTFSIRQTFSPDRMLRGPLEFLALNHPRIALDASKLSLLLPGLMIELGFFSIVLLVYLLPALRGRTPLTEAQKSLLFIAMSALVFSSCLRSNVLNINDFGVRCALFLQFVAILFGSELLTSWSLSGTRQEVSEIPPIHLIHTPLWLRRSAKAALVLGVITTIHQSIIFRFTFPIAYAVRHMRSVPDPIASNLAHNAYISNLGYSKLNAVIPQNAIVQANPSSPMPFWSLIDVVNVDRQTAIVSDKPWCGAELGGDTSGCLPMSRDIDALYKDASASQALAICRKFKIDYLVSRIYDPAWQDKQSWVWTLNPVVADPEFRALDCR